MESSSIKSSSPAKMKNAQPDWIALIVDPDPRTYHLLADLTEGLGLRPVRASTAVEALARFHSATPTVVLLDFNLPDMPGRQLLSNLRKNGTNVPVIVVAASPDIQTAIEATRGGATEFLDKSTDLDRLQDVLEAILPKAARLPFSPLGSEVWDRDRLDFFRDYEMVFYRSDKMRPVEKLVLQVADTSATVLIQGETGAGKEFVAKALHYLSDRATKPWLKVNCASLPAELLESELFGHEKGAFTGALFRKPGRFELANGGTILLDEIGEMPLSLQSKILHVLQDSKFFRVGGRELITVDARVLAATNKNIHMMVASGTFREDLYYRLNVVNIFVPPLRERREEIPILVEYFREKFMREFNRRSAPLSADTQGLLLTYHWPGNIRELENCIKRHVLVGDEAHLRDDLVVRLKAVSPQRLPFPAPIDGAERRDGLRAIAGRAAREAEQVTIKEVLERVGWNRAAAARLLKISYKTLLSKINQGGLRKPPEQGSGLPTIG